MESTEAARGVEMNPGPDGTVAGAEARKWPRVKGPFDGKWITDLTLPLRIHDLSMGGCLVESYHPRPAGQRFTLELCLPMEGWISVEAETLYSRADYGYAVRFTHMADDERGRLERALERLYPRTAP